MPTNLFSPFSRTALATPVRSGGATQEVVARVLPTGHLPKKIETFSIPCYEINSHNDIVKLAQAGWPGVENGTFFIKVKSGNALDQIISSTEEHNRNIKPTNVENIRVSILKHGYTNVLGTIAFQIASGNLIDGQHSLTALFNAYKDGLVALPDVIECKLWTPEIEKDGGVVAPRTLYDRNQMAAETRDLSARIMSALQRVITLGESLNMEVFPEKRKTSLLSPSMFTDFFALHDADTEKIMNYYQRVAPVLRRRVKEIVEDKEILRFNNRHHPEAFLVNGDDLFTILLALKLAGRNTEADEFYTALLAVPQPGRRKPFMDFLIKTMMEIYKKNRYNGYSWMSAMERLEFAMITYNVWQEAKETRNWRWKRTDDDTYIRTFDATFPPKLTGVKTSVQIVNKLAYIQFSKSR